MKKVTRELTRIMVYEGKGIGMRTTEHAERLGLKPGAPADMLRYDHAFECSRFPGVVLFVSYKVKGSGLFSGHPTVARWSSFSVSLSERKDLIETVEQDIRLHGGEWMTWVHRQTDYILEPKSLTTFLSEEAR